jgi:hypothetical protein
MSCLEQRGVTSQSYICIVSLSQSYSLVKPVIELTACCRRFRPIPSDVYAYVYHRWEKIYLAGPAALDETTWLAEAPFLFR